VLQSYSELFGFCVETQPVNIGIHFSAEGEGGACVRAFLSCVGSVAALQLLLEEEQTDIAMGEAVRDVFIANHFQPREHIDDLYLRGV